MSEHGGTGTPGGGPDAALAELGRVITRTAEALTTIAGDDDATAYRCARALDAAFSDLAELLAAVPGIVGLGEPGRVVSERLEQRRTELATRRDEVRAYREMLDDLADSEQHLAEVTAEAGQLHERVGELERAKRLATEIPGLRTQLKALEEAVAAADAADAPQLGERIAAAADQLGALTGPQRELIGEQADELVTRAQAAARDLDEQRARRDAAAADLAKRESEAAQLAADYSDALPVLTAWSKADADLAEGLRAAGLAAGGTVLDAGGTPLEAVAAELEGVRERLTELDDRLRPLLADHAKAYEQTRQVRPL
jgi:DNA repair exonuclease SbcCD ATPase subunit